MLACTKPSIGCALVEALLNWAFSVVSQCLRVVVITFVLPNQPYLDSLSMNLPTNIASFPSHHYFSHCTCSLPNLGMGGTCSHGTHATLNLCI